MGSQGATARSAAAPLYHTKTFKLSTTLLGGKGEFSAVLMQEYGIEAKESRGRYSYLAPERAKPVTARKLRTDFGKTAALAAFAENAIKAAQTDKSRQEYPELQSK